MSKEFLRPIYNFSPKGILFDYYFKIKNIAYTVALKEEFFKLPFKYNLTVVTIFCALLIYYSIDRFKLTFRLFKRQEHYRILAILLASDFIISFLNIKFRNFPGIEMRFNFAIRTVVSIIYGPLIGGFFALISEITNFILKPNAIFLPLTIFASAMSSIVSGIFLFDRDFSFLRLLLTRFVTTFLINCFIISTALSGNMHSNNLWLAERIMKNVFLFPLELIIVMIIAYLMSKFLKKDETSYSFLAIKSDK